MKKKILFIVPYPTAVAPSQRFRFEQYYSFLKESNIEFDIAPFLDLNTWKILYRPGHFTGKVWGIMLGFLRRMVLMFQLKPYDFVFIHREASPLGPPFFEWWISRVAKKRIIYDFDDAIWLENVSENNRWISRFKGYQKVPSIIRWSYRISCGNDFLADYARQFHDDVIVNPTTIDMEGWHNQVQDQQTPPISVGWTGSHTTMAYLEAVVPVLRRVQKDLPFTFVLISNRAPEWELPYLSVIPWQKEREIEDLLRFHIGLMPIPDDDWAKGKCGFKALQYMSLGIPALVSPVAVNCKIVDDGVNGFWCASEQDWEQALRRLLTEEGLRVKMAKAAREKIWNDYSVHSNRGRFLGLFQ